MTASDRLRVLVAEATPGPWFVNVNDLIGGVMVAAVEKPASAIDPRTELVIADMLNRDEDAALIALAPQLAELCADMGEALEEAANFVENDRGDGAANDWREMLARLDALFPEESA